MPSDQADIQLFNESGADIPITIRLADNLAHLISIHEQCSFSFIEIVYVDEQEIVRINKEHLDRSYVTDIITFRYDENTDNKNIEGTIFCCAPRIREQAAEFNQEPSTEFSRILIHGLLHLAGYDDQSEQDKKNMTARENHYLQLISNKKRR